MHRQEWSLNREISEYPCHNVNILVTIKALRLILLFACTYFQQDINEINLNINVNKASSSHLHPCVLWPSHNHLGSYTRCMPIPWKIRDEHDQQASLHVSPHHTQQRSL